MKNLESKSENEAKPVLADVHGLPEKIKKDMACDRIGRKLVKYLEENRAKGVIDFQLRIDSDTHFYLHPNGVDGETLDIDFSGKSVNYGSEVFGYVNKSNGVDSE